MWIHASNPANLAQFSFWKKCNEYLQKVSKVFAYAEKTLDLWVNEPILGRT